MNHDSRVVRLFPRYVALFYGLLFSLFILAWAKIRERVYSKRVVTGEISEAEYRMTAIGVWVQGGITAVIGLAALVCFTLNV